MLHISRSMVQEITKSAEDQHPIEACGLITKKNDSSAAARLIPMKNVAKSETYFQFDSKEQLRIWRELEDSNEYLWVLYHSHTSSEAYPSRTDISFSLEPHVHYVIVSTAETEVEKIRSFRIHDGRVIEENIRVYES